MRSGEEIEAAFRVGWSEVPQTWENSQIRDRFDSLAQTIWHTVPNGPEKTLALRSLWTTQSQVQLALCLAGDPEA